MCVQVQDNRSENRICGQSKCYAFTIQLTFLRQIEDQSKKWEGRYGTSKKVLERRAGDRIVYLAGRHVLRVTLLLGVIELINSIIV